MQTCPYQQPGSDRPSDPAANGNQQSQGEQGPKKRGWKAWLAIIGGGLLTLAGLAMLVLPGPGILALAGGLALLGTQFPQVGKFAQKIKDKVRGKKGGDNNTEQTCGRPQPHPASPH